MSKPVDERLNEAVKMYNQLADVGLAGRPEVAAFRQTVKAFVRDGIGATGSVKLPGLQRVLEYKLPTTSGRPCHLVLRHSEHT